MKKKDIKKIIPLKNPDNFQMDVANIVKNICFQQQ